MRYKAVFEMSAKDRGLLSYKRNMFVKEYWDSRDEVVEILKNNSARLTDIQHTNGDHHSPGKVTFLFDLADSYKLKDIEFYLGMKKNPAFMPLLDIAQGY